MRSEKTAPCPPPHRCHLSLLAGFLLTAHGLLLAPAASAQQWNSPESLALIHRAIARREVVQRDSTLASYRTRAHGFVFFLVQVGEGLSEPPRLAKADELAVEVYWKAPDRSKQVILGWRDGRWLPTDIAYHRDHLGIVTNNFGDLIRIGEGDEVRDVLHPLSFAGPEVYDYALGDSLSIRSGTRELSVREVMVRPRSHDQPLVVGTLFLDLDSAELVRFRFGFTPAAYLDHELEDLSVVLENSLVDGRWWLPYRQEIEIRRRTTWLDFPARGIVRGRWEIEEYELGVPIPDPIFAGPAIGGLLRPRPGYPWTEPLDEAIAGVAAPVNRQDMDALRVEVERIAGSRALGGLPSRRLATGSLSDLVHVNRVQGLTLGFGATVALGERRVELRPRVAYGFSDGRVTGGLEVGAGTGATRVTVAGRREIRDFSDLPVISPVLNSFLAQEAGDDHGDYVLLEGVSLGVRHRLSGRATLAATVGVERSRTVGIAASPATGSYRPNPALGAGTYRTLSLGLERASGGIAVERDLQGRVGVELGDGATRYVRIAGEGRWLAPVPGGRLLGRLYAGAGSSGLPAYRSFVLGGRGTLPGEPYRAYGGRRAALAQLEWQLDVPVPAIGLGSFASTGRSIVIAPFVAAGWTELPPAGPWRSEGIRPVAGIAVEWFMRLLRVEAGVGLRTGDIGVSVDVSRDWWGVL